MLKIKRIYRAVLFLFPIFLITTYKIILVLHPVSNDTLHRWKNLLYSIKNGIGGRRHATLHCHADKR